MCEPRQNVAFASETFSERVVVQQDNRKLQRHLPFEQTVGAFGQPDEAHAAAAQFADQAVRPDHRPERQRRITGDPIAQGNGRQSVQKRVASRGSFAHDFAQRWKNVCVFGP